MYIFFISILAGSGIFLWRNTTSLHFYQGETTLDGRTLSIKVVKTGHYYVFARVAVNGRNPYDGSSLDQR